MQPKALLIAEKSSLMRAIREVYEKHKDAIAIDIDFMTQRGHLVRLKMPDEIDEEMKEWAWETLPFHPDEKGGWRYAVIQEKKTGNFKTAQERFEEIKGALHSGKYDFVINAGDPDQEGQLLIHLVLNKAKNALPVKRFWSNNLTEPNIKKALQNLRDDQEPFFTQLLDAAYARQRSDYRFGLNLTRAATLQMGGKAAIGRVKAPILNLVVTREKEIRNFVPKTVYGVRVDYKEGFHGRLFLPEEKEADEKEEEENEETGILWFDTKEEAQARIKALGNTATIKEYRAKQTRKLPPRLFKLATVQDAAGKAFGYEAKEVLEHLQVLYEKQLYHTPNHLRLHPQQRVFRRDLTSGRQYQRAQRIYQRDYPEAIQRVRKTKKWANDKEVEKEGHTAIIPTTKPVGDTPLSPQQRNIYNLVARQFVAIFLPDLVEDKVEIVTENNGQRFKTTGKTLVDPGYTKLLEINIQDVKVPQVEEGQTVQVEKTEVTEKTSTCPKRYTTGDLIMACENPAKYLDDDNLKKLGKNLTIGTPATRATIFEELIERDGYIQKGRRGKREVLAPTPVGEAIIENLKDFAICKVDMTGYWEEELIQIRKGELALDEVEARMKERVNEAVRQMKNTPMKKLPGENKTYRDIGTCPRCGGTLIEGPKTYFCSGNKEKGCRVGGFKSQYGAEITLDDFKRMLNGEAIEKEMDFKGSQWKQEVSLNEEGTITPIQKQEDTGWACPACGKPYGKATALFLPGKTGGNLQGHFIPAHCGKRNPQEEFRRLFTTGQTGIIKAFKVKTRKDLQRPDPIDTNDKRIYLEEQEETDMRCPVCERTLLQTRFRYICEGKSEGHCNFQMYNSLFKKPLPKETIRTLLQKVKTGDIHGKEQAFITDGPIPTSHVCPFCGDTIYKNNMQYICGGVDKGTCKFKAYRNIGTQIMDDVEFENLLTAGKTTVFQGLQAKSGFTYNARGVLDWDTQQMKTEPVNEAMESKYACPLCKKTLMKNGRKYTCSCGFTAWSMVGKRDLTEKEVEQLFTKGETEYLTGLKKKDGSDMSPAKLVIDAQKRATALVFRQTKRKGWKE